MTRNISDKFLNEYCQAKYGEKPFPKKVSHIEFWEGESRYSLTLTNGCQEHPDFLSEKITDIIQLDSYFLIFTNNCDGIKKPPHAIIKGNSIIGFEEI